jgi:hypothetical protein
MSRRLPDSILRVFALARVMSSAKRRRRATAVWGSAFERRGEHSSEQIVELRASRGRSRCRPRRSRGAARRSPRRGRGRTGRRRSGTSPCARTGRAVRGPTRQAAQHARRLVEVEQREPHAVDAAGDRLLDAVVDQQPAVLGLERRRADADPQRVPPRAGPRLEHLLGRAPACRSAERETKISPRPPPNSVFGRWKQDPPAVHALREQRRVLVLGSPDDPAPLDGREVFGGREIDGRPGRTVRGAGDHPALELVDPDDAGSSKPHCSRSRCPLRGEQRLGVDRPAVDPVRRAGDGEVRDAGEIFDPREQDGLAVDAAAPG